MEERSIIQAVAASAQQCGWKCVLCCIADARQLLVVVDVAGLATLTTASDRVPELPSRASCDAQLVDVRSGLRLH